MTRTRPMPNLVTILFAVALVLRLVLIPNPGFEADISFWKSWGLATVDRGIVEGMKITNNNYPTPFAYTLGGLVWIYKQFADPHAFREFWMNTNLLFLTISKMLPILADFGIAGVMLFIGKRAKSVGFPDVQVKMFGLSLYELLATAYLFSPLALIDGAWWGQVDSLGVVIFLGAVVLVLKKQPFLAGIVFMISMMTKLQNMIYGPLFFLFVWQLEGFPGLLRSAAGAFVSFIGLNSEFLLSKNADRVLASLTENYDYFPWMSLIAFNVWWIVSGAQGLVTSDKYLMVGILNAKTVGLMLFASFYLFAMARQYLESLKTTPTNPEDKHHTIRLFFEGLVLINGAFFLFQTQSHDRYAFPISVFLLFWAPFIALDRKERFSMSRFKMLGIWYAAFTIMYFYNLHTALAMNYPQNGIPILSLMTQPSFTIPVAFVLIGLFLVYLLSLLRESRVSSKLCMAIVTLYVIGLFIANMPLITNKPIHLTTFTPFISEQAYGTRQTNRTVQSSFGGPYKWNRLSVQYLFYDRGIGSHANSRYVYDIGGHFNRFTADYGIDTESGVKASAVFEVYGDGNLLFRSEKMGRFDLPRHIDVPVIGVKRLMLIITDAGDGNYDDHADWLNPTLWPK